jgi:hypothetical protein
MREMAAIRRRANVPASCGGHCVNAVAYDPHHVTVVTWGKLLKGASDSTTTPLRKVRVTRAPTP